MPHVGSPSSLPTMLDGWSLPLGGLSLVTPTTRARPAKVEALADFFIETLSHPAWRSPPRR